MTETDTPAPPRALVGWRLLAMTYDFFPVLALWFLAAGVFTALHGDAVRGGWLGLLEFVALWLLAGAYAVLSWRRGGQTRACGRGACGSRMRGARTPRRARCGCATRPPACRCCRAGWASGGRGSIAID